MLTGLFSIVPITEAHIEDFCAAVDSVSRERKYLSFLEGPPLEQARVFVLENLHEVWPHFVALEGTKLVGWCDITSKHRPVYAHSGILGIGVLAAWRGQGVGKKLMQAALDAARDKGLTRVELSVNAANERAAALYRKFGFIVEGVRRKAVCIDGVYQDSIEMGLLLSTACDTGRLP